MIAKATFDCEVLTPMSLAGRNKCNVNFVRVNA